MRLLCAYDGINMNYNYVVLNLIFTARRYAYCVSAVFAVARCLSVRPSVTLLHCIHMAEDIVKLISRPGSLSF